MNKIILFVLLIAASVTGFLFFIEQESLEPLALESLPEPKTTFPIPSKIKIKVEQVVNIEKEQGSATEILDETGTVIIWPHYYPQLEEWRQKNFGRLAGFMMSNSDYNGYSIEMLEALSKQGDFLAMHALGWKYHKLSDFKNAQRIYSLAAIYGSTSALTDLAHLEYALTKHRRRKSFAVESRREDMMKLAYYQAAVLRGDTAFLSSAKFIVEGLANSDGGELTDAEKKIIQKSGRKIYQQLERGRRLKGLKPFANQMPPYVADFFEHQLRSAQQLVSGDSPFFLTE